MPDDAFLEQPVPQYYFDIDDGDRIDPDTDGLELPDDASARLKALDALPDIAREKIPDGDHRTFQILVRDGERRVIYTATLTLMARWTVPPAG
jgi:hypothetical protein